VLWAAAGVAAVGRRLGGRGADTDIPAIHRLARAVRAETLHLAHGGHGLQELLASMAEGVGEALRGIPTAERALEARLVPLRLRPAAQRYWQRYALFIVAGAYGAYLLRQRGGDLRAWAASVWEGVRGFVRDHVELPLREMAGEVFEGSRRKVADADGLANAQRDLAAMLTRYHGKLLAKRESSLLPPDIAAEDLLKLAEKLDMRAVSLAWVSAVDKPFVSLAGGDLVELAFIQIAYLKKEMVAALAAMDTLLAENRFNLAVMTTIPGVLLLSGVSYVVGWVAAAATTPVDMTDARMRVRLTLRDLRRAVDAVERDGLGLEQQQQQQQRRRGQGQGTGGGGSLLTYGGTVPCACARLSLVAPGEAESASVGGGGAGGSGASRRRAFLEASCDIPSGHTFVQPPTCACEAVGRVVVLTARLARCLRGAARVVTGLGGSTAARDDAARASAYFAGGAVPWPEWARMCDDAADIAASAALAVSPPPGGSGGPAWGHVDIAVDVERARAALERLGECYPMLLE
jgi:hypothetical protein